MARLLFEKIDDAIWMSHLDLMRVFQRAFQRAGLPLKHTQGFNPRPSVSIALPMSVGIESLCELLDFDLETSDITDDEIMARLNNALVKGVQVLGVFSQGMKIRDLTRLHVQLTLEYDQKVPEFAISRISDLFQRESLLVEKKTKSGTQMQDIIPMIHSVSITCANDNIIVIDAIISCQNPTLNPNQLIIAISQEIPDCKPDFFKCSRIEIFDKNNVVFR